MADAKISALTDGGAPQNTDEIPVNRAGTNVKLAVTGFATQAELDAAIDHQFVSRYVCKR